MSYTSEFGNYFGGLTNTVFVPQTRPNLVQNDQKMTNLQKCIYIFFFIEISQ